MANKEMTRAQALEFAIDAIHAYHAENLFEGSTPSVAIEILEKMHAQVTKPRKKSDAPTKVQILNRNLAEKCYAAMENQESVTSKWLIEHVNGLMTSQKTTAVMKILVEDGRVTKNREGKVITYSRA